MPRSQNQVRPLSLNMALRRATSTLKPSIAGYCKSFAATPDTAYNFRVTSDLKKSITIM